jgi:hypothetical protein
MGRVTASTQAEAFCALVISIATRLTRRDRKLPVVLTRSLSSEHYTAHRAAHPSPSILPFQGNIKSLRKLRHHRRGSKLRYAARDESRLRQLKYNLVVSWAA